MPSKRELVGADAPFDGLRWSDFQWTRIFAAVGGFGAVALYLSINPSQYLPDWAGASLASIPVGLVLYGVTEQRWQTAVRIPIGVGIGSGLTTYADSVGIHLFA